MDLKKKIIELEDDLNYWKDTHAKQVLIIKDYQQKEEDTERSILREKKIFEQEKEDLKTESDLEIRKLKNQIKHLAKENEELNGEKYREIKKLYRESLETIKDLKGKDDTFKIRDLEKQIDIKNKEIKYKDDLLTKYQDLPDVKRMLDVISEMRVPAVDEMKNMFELFSNKEATKQLSETLNMLKESNEIVKSTIKDIKENPFRYR
jgi:hypothetical protein